MLKKLRIKEAIITLIAIATFIAINYFSIQYEEQLVALFEGRGLEVVLLYILFIVVSFVVPPINSVFLFPVMVVLYGPLIAVIASVFAWTAGGLLTYYISRKYGRKVVKFFIKEEKIDELEKKVEVVSSKYKIFGLFILHALLPGDVLGYVLGLFVKVPYTLYALLIFLGNIPFTLTALLAVQVSLFWQIVISVIIVLTTLFGIKLFGDKFIKQ